MTSQTADALSDRLTGQKPGFGKALLASVGVGFAVAILTYRFLRSE